MHQNYWFADIFFFILEWHIDFHMAWAKSVHVSEEVGGAKVGCHSYFLLCGAFLQGNSNPATGLETWARCTFRDAHIVLH